VLHNGVLYAPNLDGKVYALNATTGERLREFEIGGPVSAAPALAGDNLIVATEGDKAKVLSKVFRIDTSTNTRIELLTLGQGEQVFAPLTAGDGVVYVHAQAFNAENNRVEGKLYAVNPVTGAQIWSPKWTSEPPPPQAQGGTNWGLMLGVAAGAIIMMLLVQTQARLNEVVCEHRSHLGPDIPQSGGERPHRPVGLPF
jgi:outer membrane protein assembly factor BamB